MSDSKTLDLGEALATPSSPASVMPRPEQNEQPQRLLERLKHQEVIVLAQGIKYQGVLQGADEDVIYLRSSTRYVTVPLDRVTKVCAADQRDELDPHKQIDPEFYDTSDLPAEE